VCFAQTFAEKSRWLSVCRHIHIHTSTVR
jgi:hypothetical protein